MYYSPETVASDYSDCYALPSERQTGEELRDYEFALSIPATCRFDRRLR